MHAPKLIISDIDGTFITPTGRVTPRLRDTVVRAVRSGAKFALATGRPHRWLMPVLDQLPIAPTCVCANGAVVYDPVKDTVVRSFELAPETMQRVVDAVGKTLAPHGLQHGFGVERVGQSALDPEEDCFLITPEYNRDAWDSSFGIGTAAEIVAEPAAKLLVRCPQLRSAELFDLVAPTIEPEDAHLTYSMDEGLIELSHPGVNKATGASVLAASYGIDPSQVIAFGDMPNDLELLAWAGMGVAMGNAAPVLLDAADYTTATNSEDGVAQVLEHWF
ncbi:MULTISPECIES: HAD family hydrolase [Corynebacterium]|uniref:HAD family hydrolase n=1 Tax=Corynebacterium hadale TaxID=2026255 RepID=A0A269PCN5_9CORY|nr:HAD family hydrolase [Corynebacterium hadale]PAJ68363.1 HAD family hydrolase [Corynebacterium hadale]WKC61167.1 Sugar phosphatase YidA [Corynebacterium hadale]